MPYEAWIWTLALLALAWTDPATPPLLDLCLLSHLGIWCPGCGLGHSIAFLLDGQLLESWHAHPMGVPAFLILSARVTYLTFRAYAQTNHER